MKSNKQNKGKLNKQRCKECGEAKTKYVCCILLALCREKYLKSHSCCEKLCEFSCVNSCNLHYSSNISPACKRG